MLVLLLFLQLLPLWHFLFHFLLSSAFESSPKVLLKFVNYGRYIKLDSKNSVTPVGMAATAETYPHQRPRGINNCNQKNSNSRTDSSTIENWNDRATGTPESVELETLKVLKNENILAPILNFVL
jgi:hypothetical protein